MTGFSVIGCLSNLGIFAARVVAGRFCFFGVQSQGLRTQPAERHLSIMTSFRSLIAVLLLLPALVCAVEESGDDRHWQDLVATDQQFANSADQNGRIEAFLEFLGRGAVVFRAGGPLDAIQLYSSEEFQQTANDLSWKAHYVDVSQAGDMGLSAGPMTILNASPEEGQDFFGHNVLIWKKVEAQWVVMADLFVTIPGFLSLDVSPNFADTQPVLRETASDLMLLNVDLQSLIDADNLFGRAINFRGGQRTLLRYGLENSRVYLPGMAPAVGAEAASSVYGAFLDNQLSTTNPISLTHMGGYLSESREMGYTFGVMKETPIDGSPGFQTNYLRLWRYSQSGEWKVAVEVLSPF